MLGFVTQQAISQDWSEVKNNVLTLRANNHLGGNSHCRVQVPSSIKEPSDTIRFFQFKQVVPEMSVFNQTSSLVS